MCGRAWITPSSIGVYPESIWLDENCPGCDELEDVAAETDASYVNPGAYTVKLIDYGVEG